MKIIYPLFQREFAYLGAIRRSITNHNSSHAGAYSSTTTVYDIGGDTLTGDYGTMPFTAKNCILFKVIKTTIN